MVKRTLSILTMLSLLLTLFVAGASAQMTPSVNAEDQDSDGQTVTVAEVVSSGAGFIVIHADNNDAPGDVIGHAAVQDGTNSNVEVTLDEAVTDGTALWAMLHTDLGTAGTYEFPGADVPVKDADGNVVMEKFTVTVEDADATPMADATATPEVAVTADATATPEAAPSTLPTTGGDAGSGTPLLPIAALLAGVILLGGALVLRPRAR